VFGKLERLATTIRLAGFSSLEV